MAEWTRGTYTTDEITLSYLKTGGNKPSIILLHGLMTNGSCWTPFARTLEHTYDVIMPDARGHGNSSAPTKGYSYHHLADDVCNLIKALKLDSFILVGHSMGGMTATLIASQNPKGLDALILLDPTFLTPQRQKEVYESDVIKQHRNVLHTPYEEFLAATRLRRGCRSYELIELLAQARLQTSLHAFEVLMPPNPDYKTLISALNIPSLLMIGDKNTVVSSLVAKELCKLNACLKYAQIKGATHGLPFDQPEECSTVMQDFLSSLTT